MKEDSSTNNIPGWNYIPKVPILVSPFFTWPINPKRMINWLISQWVPLSENLILLFLVLISWGWLQPSLEDTRIIQVEWVMKIWLRNLALMTLVAGSLHWFFYSKKKQGNVYRYDKRDRIQNGPRFIFKKLRTPVGNVRFNYICRRYENFWPENFTRLLRSYNEQGYDYSFESPFTQSYTVALLTKIIY